MSAVIRLGTQGWSYPDWIGVFYPPRAKQEHYLPFYVRIFDTVELDTTFYHPPKASVVRSWAKYAPAHFRFAAKVPQRITHEARLTAMGEHLQAFVAALDPLGEKLGPLLVQMPAEFEHDAANAGVLDRFLAARPHDVKLAVELRHASWQRPDVYDLMRRRGAAFAWTEWRTLPRVTEVTADFLYARWMGSREDIATYDRVQVDRTAAFDAWQRDLEAALPRVKEVFGYFNNHWAGHSPASAAEMRRRLGLTTTDPKAEWPQGELW